MSTFTVTLAEQVTTEVSGASFGIMDGFLYFYDSTSSPVAVFAPGWVSVTCS